MKGVEDSLGFFQDSRGSLRDLVNFWRFRRRFQGFLPGSI